MSLKYTKLVLLLLVTAVLMACNTIPNVEEMLPDRKVEYKKTKQAGANLEIPPDLTNSSISDSLVIPGALGSGSATYSDFASRDTTPGNANKGSVIPKFDDIQVKRDGNKRWLVIKAGPDDVWSRIIDFWQDSGILMVEQDPSIGIMVTDWVENRADIKSDFITDSVRKLFDGAYSAATRDQYRVRVEHGADTETVEVFLTHRGMQEEVVSASSGEENNRTVWIPRPTDHGLEAEMLRRIMVHMGVADQEASRSLARKGTTATKRSKLNRGRDQVFLAVNEELPRAWRLTGVALDRVGFAVEDRNRSDGVYFVRYNDPMKDVQDPGILDKLAFWKEEKAIDKENRYQVKLNPDGSITKIMILDEAGSRDNSPTAVRILTLLHEQMR